MFELLNSICGMQNVCIYTDRNDMKKFHYGSVLAVNELETAIYMIDEEGKYDGVLGIETDEIIRVDVDSQYTKQKMHFLCNEDSYRNFEYEINAERVFKSLLDIAMREHILLSIEVLNSGEYDISGFVVRISSDCVEMNVVDSYGDDDGHSYINLNDITKICLSSDFERRTERLWHLKNCCC